MFGRRPASSHGFRFHILPAAAGLLAALAALVALPLQAQAQTAYVSNIGQSENASALGVSSFDQGQGFTTGAATAGYVLASVDIKLESSINTILSGSEIPTVTIVQGTPTGTVAATLTKPASIAANTTADYTFTAPANTTLSASTTYYVVMEGGRSGISAARTNLDAEDSGGESDWSIADVSNWRSASSNGSFSTTAATLMIKVKGPGTTPTNADPTFPSSTAARSVAENTAAGQNVGAVLTATDSDGDTLTYTLEGTAAASFDLVTTAAPAAQIRTKTGVTYNHEAKSSYTVVVKADDGNGGTAATVTVTISVTDVTEAPGRPAAPSVSATSGSTTSLDVSSTPCPASPTACGRIPPRQGFFEHPEYLAVRAHLPAPWQDILDLAYYSGWRKNEILGLTWDELDEAGGVIRLSPARSKTLVGRILPISQPIAEALARRRARRDPDSPLVFHRDGIPVRRWRTAWRTACQAAGVPTRFLHDCRRTAARNLIRASVPERVAMLLTGHKTRAIFDRYNIIHEQELLEAGDQLVAYLAQHAQATPRGRAHPASPRPAPPLRLVRRTTA